MDPRCLVSSPRVREGAESLHVQNAFILCYCVSCVFEPAPKGASANSFCICPFSCFSSWAFLCKCIFKEMEAPYTSGLKSCLAVNDIWKPIYLKAC